MTFAARRKMSRLAECFSFDQAGDAAFAATTAFLTSSMDADDEFHTCSCDAGDVTGNVVSVVTSLPLMRSGTVYEGSGLTTLIFDMITVWWG